MIQFDPKMCSVFIKNGMTMIILPSGEEVPGQLMRSTLNQEDEFMNVFDFSLIVNLVDSKEEAMRLYKEGDKDK